MKYLFAQENTDLLAQLAWTRTLLGFDFEWVLPGHEGRMRAPSRAAMRAHLQAAIERARRAR